MAALAGPGLGLVWRCGPAAACPQADVHPGQAELRGCAAVLVDQKTTLDGDLKSTADISLTQGTVSGSCAGIDTDGNAIASTLNGTASVAGANRCSGTFKVTRGTEVINENEDFNCI